MRYLTILLALLIGCSTSTQLEPEETYPKRYGEWVVESPEYGEWIGKSKSSYKSQADTLIISAPGQHDLSITRKEFIENGVKFTISDTSIHEGDIVPTQSVIGLPNGAFEGSDLGRGNHLGIDFNYYERYLTIGFNLEINCEYDGNEKHMFWTLYRDHENTVYRVYRFNTDGYIGAIQDVAGC